MIFQGKKIGWALTGSFCTLANVLKQMKVVKDEGAEIYPFISEAVANTDTRFGTSVDWIAQIEEVTGNKVVKTISEAEPFGPTKLLDILLIAPCTGNTLAKIANAITDTPVTMISKAHIRNKRPLVLSIATNDGLGANAKNIGLLLNMKNVYFVPVHQDDPIQKCNSLVAVNEKLIPTIAEALEGRQIQPMI